MHIVHELPHQIQAKSPDLALINIRLEVGQFYIGWVERPAFVAHGDGQGVAIEDCLTRSRQECERLFA